MLNFKDWMMLSKEEKIRQYANLSESDKFLVRQGNYFDNDNNKNTNQESEFIKEIDEMYKNLKQGRLIVKENK